MLRPTHRGGANGSSDSGVSTQLHSSFLDQTARTSGHVHTQNATFLSQPSGFTFPFQQAKNITFTAWTFNVTDNGTVQIVQKSNTDLRYITSVTGSAQNFVDLQKEKKCVACQWGALWAEKEVDGCRHGAVLYTVILQTIEDNTYLGQFNLCGFWGVSHYYSFVIEVFFMY